jgi:hypothetical protein
VNSRLDESAFVGEYHGLDPVPELQLGQDAGHVRLDGRFAQEQRGADLGVGAAVRDQGENLQFPRVSVSRPAGLLAPDRGRRT